MIRSFSDYLLCFLRWRQRPVTAWLIAARLFTQARYRESIPYYRKGLANSPNHPAAKEIRLDFAYSLFRMGHILEAIAQLEEVLKLTPNSTEVILKLAYLQAWIGRDSEVVSTISAGLLRVTPSRQLLSLLAISAMRLKGKSDFVRMILIKAKALPEIGNKRGDHLLKIALAKYALISGDRYLGRKYLMELASEDNTSPEALTALSELLLVEGKVVFARQQLRRALNLVPQQPLILALLSETYLIEGAGYQPQFALQLALSAVQASTWNSPEALYALAKAYLFADNSDAALIVLERAYKELSSGLALCRVGESIEQLREQLKSDVIGIEG